METTNIGGIEYYIDRFGDVQQVPNDNLQADRNVVHNSFVPNQEPEQQEPESQVVIDTPLYQPCEADWQYASDYTYLISEWTRKRRRLTSTIDTRSPHGRPPDAEHPP